ncbi:MAG: hypothetical protein ACJAYB_000285 [Psychromonas sp.]|jgi:hypothetical protein
MISNALKESASNTEGLHLVFLYIDPPQQQHLATQFIGRWGIFETISQCRQIIVFIE